ncbi:MAG: YfhO family protein, partial [Acidimicrobiales bacterium]
MSEDSTPSTGGSLGAVEDASEDRPSRRGALGTLFTYRTDVLGVALVILVALLYLSPAVKDGFGFGPTDLVSGASVLTQSLFTVLVHNHPVVLSHNHLAGDVGDQGVPWNAIDWRIVHQGSIPLWNSTAGTGLPQLFNFESAALALPTLIAYLFPLSASFLVTVLGKLLIAGIGTYVCCRVLGTRAAGATLGGISFMLSGSFSGWLGWSISGPVAWSGFILAGVVLAYRSRRRARDLWLLAVSVAFAIYGGFPEMYVIMGPALLGAAGVAALLILVRDHKLYWRGIGRVLTGSIAGFALSAPLWLPGISVVKHSARSAKHLDGGLVAPLLHLMFAQGYYGLPISGSVWFTNLSNYYESAAYLGIVAIVCAALGVVLYFRRPIVIGLSLAGFGTLIACYDIFGGIGKTIFSDIGLGAVAVHRGLPVFEFCVAVVAGIGFDALLRRFTERRVQIVLFVILAAVSFEVVELWRWVDLPSLNALDRALRTASLRSLPTPSLRALRTSSLVWPTWTTGMLIVVALAFVVVPKRSAILRRWVPRAVAALFVGAQGAFLVIAGVGINSYFKNPFPTDPAVKTVARLVGSGMLAADTPGNLNCLNLPAARVNKPCGVRMWEGYGFIPNVQGGYDIDELAMHDPIIPQRYFDAWPVPDAGQVFKGNVGFFSPSITSVALARRYGVTTVLLSPGYPLPKGMNLVAEVPVGNHNKIEVATVPGSSRFDFVGKPNVKQATVLSYTQTNDATYTLNVDVPETSTLFLHLTYFSGWHVTANGHPLKVTPFEGMFEVRVPAGSTMVTAHYWPRTFTEGIVLAAVSLLALALWPALPLAGSAGRALVVA